MIPLFRGFANALHLDRQPMARYDAPSRSATPQGYSWQTMGGNRISPFDNFDNVFPYVNAIAQRFATVIPYAVDSDNRRYDQPPTALAALYAPNDTQSCLDFLKFVATSMLTQSHLDVLIWTRQGGQIMAGGNVTADNIAGYTFLPQSSRQYDSSRSDYYHRCTMSINGVEGEYEFGRDESIALTYAVHPVDPTRGISPAMTIQKWANVDDLIADYERGFFGNGAVPAGMLGIVSETADDFTRNRNRLEDTFRGAGNNNGVVYNWIPIDPLTRKPSDGGKLVWVPFQQSNNTLDLNTVNDVVNGRLANAMAVPDIVRGIDNGQTYANAQMAERSFIENTLKPLCMTVWDKWQFELDRITGGLGYGITFDMDLPAQTDVEKVMADTQQVQVNSFLALVNAGASPKAAAAALCLPDTFARLEITPPVDTSSVSPSTPSTPTLTLPNRRRFERKKTADEKAYDAAYIAAKKMYRRLVSIATSGKFAKVEPMETVAVEFVNEAFIAYQPRILSYAKANGKSIMQAILDLAEISPGIREILRSYTAPQLAALYDWDALPDTYREAYTRRLENVALDAARNGVNEIQNILDRADRDGLTAEATQDMLAAFVAGPRAELLARNELVNSERLGSLYSAKSMSEDMGIPLVKVWNVTADDPCPFCAHMDGQKIPLDGSWMNKGDVLTIDGKDYANTFEDKTTPDGHPNCRCVATFEVDEEAMQ